MLRKYKNLNLLLFFSIFVIFCPLFQNQVGLLLEQFLSVIITLFFYYYIIITKAKISRISVNIFITFLVLISISLVRSLDIVIFKDLFEYIKPFLFFSIFTVFSSYNWDEDKVEYYFKYFFLILFVTALIGCAESFFEKINNITTYLYKDDRGGLYMKAVCSFISPYTFASVLIFPVFYSFLLFFIKKEKKNHSFCFFSVFFICLLRTQSKTVLLSFIFSFFVFSVMLIFCKWIPNRKILLTFAISVIIIIIISLSAILTFAKEHFSYLYSGFEAIFKQFESGDIEKIIYSTPSLSNRYEQLKFAIEAQDFIPLLGVGIGKKEVMLESFYALYLYRYGLLGIIIYFCFLCYFIKLAFKFAKEYSVKRPQLFYLFLAIDIFLISLPVSFFSSSVMDQIRSGYIFYMILGILSGLNKYKINNV